MNLVNEETNCTKNTLSQMDTISGLGWDEWDAPLQSPWGLSVNATPLTESFEGSKEEPYGICVEQKYINGDVDGHPCGARPTLWFISEVQTENRYIKKTHSTS